MKQNPTKTSANYSHLISQIFPENPYNGFNFQQYPEDLQGWNGRHKVFAEIISEVKPKVIIEVGVWKGQSTIHMAEIAKKINPEVIVIAIDTFLGSPEHWKPKHPKNFQQSLQLKFGYPQLYYQFLANVMWKGLEKNIIPIPQTSVNAAIMLKNLGIKGDIIHIDAGHDFENVYSDLVKYWDLLTEEGVLIGDDFHPAWPGVQRAVKCFCSERQLQIIVDKPKCIIRRQNNNVENKTLFSDKKIRIFLIATFENFYVSVEDTKVVVHGKNFNPLIKLKAVEIPGENGKSEFFLTTNDGYSLCAEHNNNLVLNKSKFSSLKKFKIEKLSDNYVAFLSAHGKYLSAEPNGIVTANANQIGQREKFKLLTLDSDMIKLTEKSNQPFLLPLPKEFFKIP